MRHGRNTLFLDELGDRHVGQRLPAGAREHKAGAVTERPCLAQDLDGAVGQRNPVLAGGLGSSGRHRPPIGVDLAPRCEPDFPGTRRRQNEELEGEFRRRPRARGTYGGDGGGDLTMRHRRHVPHLPGGLRQRRRDRVAGGVVLPVASRDGPLHHGPDSAANLPGGLVFLHPDGYQYGQHVGRCDLVDALLADGGGVLPQGRPPQLCRLAGILPGFAVDRDDLLDGISERRHLGAALLGQRVDAVCDGDAVGERALSCLCQRNDGPRTETEIVALSV